MRKVETLLLMVCAAAVGLTVVQIARWHAAQSDRASSERTLLAASADAAELGRLRAASEVRIFGEPPAEDFFDRVGRTLISIGLNPSIATNIVREADRGVSGTAANQRRREMRIELRPMSPPDLGRFLTAWNADNPAWTPRQIALRKVNDRRADPGDYQVTLTLSAEYTVTSPLPTDAGGTR